MTTIWGFLVQTIMVSLVAVLLLVVKELLADKLSPRWQYGVWGVLALRIVLPVSMARSVLLPVPLWVETWKGMVEQNLHSAYAAVYTPISIKWPIPILNSGPQSITDWLFVIYAVGVAVVLLWYLVSYLRLRLILQRGSPVVEATQAKIQYDCMTYSLRPCPAVAVKGLPSAFVCGVLRPILVLPAEAETDDKVLLHELLHLKHRDALQSVGWCILRALHWCNPFLQYIFNRIGNDMESLCDQRVLEQLEGEERREYGSILLAMANDRYPRAPGTTSVSNGGKNITRRITAIVRFKKYPKGMGLVSVCIAFVFAFSVLVGTAPAYQSDTYHPVSVSKLEGAMSLARIQRCTTVAGALDTYAKGLLYENGVYIAMASPLDQHEELNAQMRYNAEADGWISYHLDRGDELEYLSQNEGYPVYNLELQEDGSYTAMLVFFVEGFLNPNGEGMLRDENGEAYSGSVAVPVTVRREGGWVVEETGERMRFLGLSLFHTLTPDTDLPWLQYYEASGQSGTVSVGVNTRYKVNNTAQSSGWNPFGGATFDETIKPNAQFGDCVDNTYIQYTFGGSEQQRNALSHVSMEMTALASLDEEPVFSERNYARDGGWSSSDGTAGCGQSVTADWDGTLANGSGGTAIMKDGLAELPVGYAVRIYWDGKSVEEFILREVN